MPGMQSLPYPAFWFYFWLLFKKPHVKMRFANLVFRSRTKKIVIYESNYIYLCLLLYFTNRSRVNDVKTFAAKERKKERYCISISQFLFFDIVDVDHCVCAQLAYWTKCKPRIFSLAREFAFKSPRLVGAISLIYTIRSGTRIHIPL